MSPPTGARRSCTARPGCCSASPMTRRWQIPGPRFPECSPSRPGTTDTGRARTCHIPRERRSRHVRIREPSGHRIHQQRYGARGQEGRHIAQSQVEDSQRQGRQSSLDPNDKPHDVEEAGPQHTRGIVEELVFNPTSYEPICRHFLKTAANIILLNDDESLNPAENLDGFKKPREQTCPFRACMAAPSTQVSCASCHAQAMRQLIALCNRKAAGEKGDRTPQGWRMVLMADWQASIVAQLGYRLTHRDGGWC